MSSAEAAQAMSTEIQLSLGPDAGPNDDSTQGRDIDQMEAEDGPKRSSNNAASEAGGHRLLGDTPRAPPNGP